MITLSQGEKKRLQLKSQKSYRFIVRLADLHNEYVEVYRCVSNSCSPLAFDITDQNGIIIFEDRVEGLNTIIYRFIHKSSVFAELHVIPILIDANEILNKVANLLETLLIARRLGAG